MITKNEFAVRNFFYERLALLLLWPYLAHTVVTRLQLMTILRMCDVFIELLLFCYCLDLL